jgi:type I restriction enzyme, R subunit
MIDKKTLSETAIRTLFIDPALQQAGWAFGTHVVQEYTLTAGRVVLKGTVKSRAEGRRADYVLLYKPNIVLAVVEAKDNNHLLRSGIQQALDYAEALDAPFAFTSNGDGFFMHDRTITNGPIEFALPLNQFPTYDELLQKYLHWKGLTTEQQRVVTQPYFTDGSARKPRYYQQIAINRTVEAIAKEQARILLVMATGTGKTYTAFQIAYLLWKSGAKKRILFLADRTALLDQTRNGDFKHFRDKLTVIQNQQVSKAHEIYLALYQGLSNNDDAKSLFRQFSPGFFDLIIVDECHRGSARDDSAWREILTYFGSATQIGLTATPKETTHTSNSEYFGEPIYTYSLRQGIEDGFLAPYRVIRVDLNVDRDGWRPEDGKTDKEGELVEDKHYTQHDYDQKLVIDERTDLVARKLTEFLTGTNRFDKTIVFCRDIDHAQRMRAALANHNADLVRENYKYVMEITSDSKEGKNELENFINPEVRYPVIAVTSKLMTTGVDAQTCKVIVLDSAIRSMTEFKQIIGRGTRLNPEFDKWFFTIIDFRNVTQLFFDPAFDGDPEAVKVKGEDEPMVDEENDDKDLPNADDLPPYNPEPVPLPVSGEDEPTDFDYTPRQKVYVNGVDVSVLLQREQYFDKDGRPITVSLKDHTRECLRDRYASLDVFLARWTAAERKDVLVDELRQQGILVDDLQRAVSKDLDLFDLLCHTAYDQPPLTRRERANNVKKQNYFAQYGPVARNVLNALLDKYADEGILTVEAPDVLSVRPLNSFGTPKEIVRYFGDKKAFQAAVRTLEMYIYQQVA